MIAVHSSTALVVKTVLATFASMASTRLRSAVSNIPTLMNAPMLKDLAKTCWSTLEDLRPYKELANGSQARQAKEQQQAAVYILLKDVFTQCYDCSAVVVWMQLRGRGMPPGESGLLYETAASCSENGSLIGHFVLGYMYGFLGPLFWNYCSCDIGTVGRNKNEAIRLLSLAKESDFLRPAASFFLGSLHELDSKISDAKEAYEQCPLHPLALWSLANCLTDAKRAQTLRNQANELGYQRVKDVYFYFHGRGTEM